MGVDYQARQIYDMQIMDVTTSADKWKSILRLAGNLYRYEFDNILLIYAQRPQATLVASVGLTSPLKLRKSTNSFKVFPFNSQVRFLALPPVSLISNT